MTLTEPQERHTYTAQNVRLSRCMRKGALHIQVNGWDGPFLIHVDKSHTGETLTPDSLKRKEESQTRKQTELF